MQFICKCTRPAAFCLPLLLIAATESAADLLIYEGFDYTVGERIIGQVNPTTSTAWHEPGAPSQPTPENDTQVIAAGNVTYAGLQSPTGESFALTPTPGHSSNYARLTLPGGPYTVNSDSKTVYFSFTMKMVTWNEIDDAVAMSTNHQNGDWIAGFTASSGGGMQAANVFAGMLRVRRQIDGGTQTGNYQLGFHKNNLQGGVADWDVTQSFGLNEEVFVVGSYELNTSDVSDDVARLWINPTPGAEATAPAIESIAGFDVSTAGGASQGNVTAVWFRSSTNYQPGDILVDELRVGASYAAVTPAGGPGLAGDFNVDGIVDGADFLAWQRGESPSAGSAGDLADWQGGFGQTSPAAIYAVPEPAAALLGLFAMLGLAMRGTRRRRA